MSSKGDLVLHGHSDTTLQHSSKSSVSLIEAHSVPISSPDSQPSNIINIEAIEPISVECEEAQPNSRYIQGWKLHILTVG